MDASVGTTNRKAKFNRTVAASSPAQLDAGEALTTGQYLTSPSGQYILVMQGDGNLVEYQGSAPLWDSGTTGTGANRAVMQSDGNFVLYNSSDAVWQTHSMGATAAYSLKLQDDNNLVIYNGSTPVWTRYVTLGAGQTLAAGRQLVSLNGQYRLVMQGDGNLVEYQDSTALWDSGTTGTGANRAVMQSDGNLVLYNSSGAVWQSHSSGAKGPYALELQGDKNLVIYNGSTAVWTRYVTLGAGQTLRAGQQLVSLGGQYTLQMQGDGNLVEYQGSTPMWNSGTTGTGANRAVMQRDGNFVVYNSSAWVWQSNTSSATSAYALVLQGDGNIVVYDGLNVVWAKNRGGVPQDDYPAPWRPPTPMDSTLDSWRELNRECTSFVAWRLYSRNGFWMPFNDHASGWGYDAQARGYAVDSTPRVGSVAWLAAGHVAWVQRVNGSNVTIEEYNYFGNGTYSYRTVPASSFRYIHFRDL
jgi:surface antigen/predicted NAD-dependent protein-ADP-ribosyltransferase YbiA (DUF1768 family)